MVQPCEHIDGGPFLQEIEHHLPSDFLWVCTDSFSYDAVIGRKHIGSLSQRQRVVTIPHGNQSRGNILESSKTTQRFGQTIETCACLPQPLRIGSNNFGYEFGKQAWGGCGHDIFSSQEQFSPPNFGWSRGGQSKALSRMSGCRMSCGGPLRISSLGSSNSTDENVPPIS